MDGLYLLWLRWSQFVSIGIFLCKVANGKEIRLFSYKKSLNIMWNIFLYFFWLPKLLQHVLNVKSSSQPVPLCFDIFVSGGIQSFFIALLFLSVHKS